VFKQKFTAKGIRDGMTMYKTSLCNVDKLTIKLSEVLDAGERTWLEEQKMLFNTLAPGWFSRFLQKKTA